MSLANTAGGEVFLLLDEAEARVLTDRIKTAVEHAWSLLEEAHQRRAWAALGYRTFEQYVKAEFGMARSTAYQLLDQATVIREISRAGGVSAMADISEREARDLKPHLAEVTDAVRARTSGVAPERVEEIVGEVVREERVRIQRQREDGRAIADLNKRYAPEGFDPEADKQRIAVTHQLYNAMQALAQMPPIDDVIEQIPDYQHYRFSDLPQAVAWLTEFAQRWEEMTA